MKQTAVFPEGLNTGRRAISHLAVLEWQEARSESKDSCGAVEEQSGQCSEYWQEPLKPGGPNLHSLVHLVDYMVAESGTALFNKIKDREGPESLSLQYKPSGFKSSSITWGTEVSSTLT